MTTLLPSPNTLSLSTFTSLANPRVFQSLAAGTLLGSCTWGSFFAGVIAYKNLPRQQFGNLQSKTFPTYFKHNVIISSAMLVNWLYAHPGTLTTLSKSPFTLTSSSTLNAHLILLGMVGTSLLNLLVITPWTSNLMYKRHRLERETGKSYTDPNPSPEMKKLTEQFGVAHGISSIVNLAYLGAVVLHAAWLATYGF